MYESQPNPLILVLGGVRSGKSSYAQRLAEKSSRVTFVATAERRDDEEMHCKIERHRADRPQHWTTVEEPVALADVVHSAAENSDTILIDCLTLFGANLLEKYAGDAACIETCIKALCVALQNRRCRVILVSNEVGSGVVPAYALGRRFRDLVGEINQRIAAVADTVVLMVAGLPLPLKGSLEGGRP